MASIYPGYDRPEELVGPIFYGPQGYVQWSLDSVGSDYRNYSSPIAYPSEADVKKLRTQVIKADAALNAAENARYVFAELADLITYQIGRTLSFSNLSVRRMVGYFDTLAVGGSVTVSAQVAGFSIYLHFNIQPFIDFAPLVLPQTKERRGGLFIPAKRTRSPKANFLYQRVPHR